jgi:hypothetical protein
MSAELRKSLIQLAFPTVAIIVGLAVARFRDISLSGDLLLVAPSWSQALFWLAIWILWIAASELVSRRLGLPQPSTWETHEPGVIVLRVFTLVIMAPIAEEFVFRGLLFQRIASTGLGIVGAILITAAPRSISTRSGGIDLLGRAGVWCGPLHIQLAGDAHADARHRQSLRSLPAASRLIPTRERLRDGWSHGYRAFQQ